MESVALRRPTLFWERDGRLIATATALLEDLGEEIRADILALEQETEGMLAEIIGGSPRLL